MKVKVYRNLTKKCLSVMNKKTSIVVDYAVDIHLKDCTFKVSETIRQKILLEKKKYVHAFIEGNVVSKNFKQLPLLLSDWTEIFYNPYVNSTFVDKKNRPIHSCSEVIILNSKNVWAKVS